jgi:hypothetical protein
MGSDRAYDVSGVAQANVPVLGEERGTKVLLCFAFRFSRLLTVPYSAKPVESTFRSMLPSSRVCRRPSSGSDMSRARAAVLAYQARAKTSRTWLRRRARSASDRSVSASRSVRRGRTSNSDRRFFCPLSFPSLKLYVLLHMQSRSPHATVHFLYHLLR